MPIYEYECTACGHTLEKLQKVSEAPLSQCPECNETSLQKLISAAGFRLSGGGWYETDFKTGNKKNLTTNGEASKSASSKDEKKSSGSNKKASTD